MVIGIGQLEPGMQLSRAIERRGAVLLRAAAQGRAEEAGLQAFVAQLDLPDEVRR